MKLLYRILLPISVVLSILLALWSVLFYVTVIREVDDETDDALEHRAEMIIQKALRGDSIPERVPGSNSSYFLQRVSPRDVGSTPRETYTDEDIYIPELREEEPARVLRRLFRNAEGRWYCLTVMIPTIEKVELRETILVCLVGIYLVILLTILLVNFSVMHHALRPLQRLLKWLDTTSVGGGRKPLYCSSDIPEYRRLYEATNGFAARAEEIFERQKQFIGNAAHEMQTPLAVCRNRLEMLVDEGTTLTDQQLEEIAKVQRTLSHLVHLNRSLLFLSKIDNGQFPESEPIDLTALVSQTAEELGEIYASRGMELRIVRHSSLTVRMNRSLAESLVSNLVKNAYVHGDERGRIDLCIMADGVTVENDGAAGPLDATQLFERFYQGAKRAGSSGLGLSIVQAICRQYDFGVSYLYIKGRHRFGVKF